MAKDKSDKEKKKEKKEKKRSETDGVHKHKKDKKEKKHSSALADAVEKELTTQVLEGLEKAQAQEATANGHTEEKESKPAEPRPVGALVPFAHPLVEDKTAKKVLKSVKKAAANKSLKRGVKEVVKALRKSPIPQANVAVPEPPGIVVLAADISPMDVISHIPVLCEDHGIPYVFVTSRAELGAAGATKRPTSVVMVTKTGKGKKKEGEAANGEDQEDFSKVYSELVKIVEKESQKVRI